MLQETTQAAMDLMPVGAGIGAGLAVIGGALGIGKARLVSPKRVARSAPTC